MAEYEKPPKSLEVLTPELEGTMRAEELAKILFGKEAVNAYRKRDESDIWFTAIWHYFPPVDTVDSILGDGCGPMDLPYILIFSEDHEKTASFGDSPEAKEYRAKQKELVEQGKFREAMQMDIDDIHEKFGDKYDGAIAEMLEHVDALEEHGII